MTGLLVFPDEPRDEAHLLGDLVLDERLQATRPREVVGTLLGIVLRIQEALGLWGLLCTASTLTLVGLVLSLSWRLRRAEVTLMRRLGASRGLIAQIIGLEAIALVAAGVVVAGCATAAGLVVLIHLSGF